MGKRKITNSIKNNKLNQTNASWICRCGVHSHYHYISNSWQEQNFSISHHLTTRNIYYYLAFCSMELFLFGCYAWLCDATCPIRQDWQHAGHRMKQSNDKIRKLKRTKKIKPKLWFVVLLFVSNFPVNRRRHIHRTMCGVSRDACILNTHSQFKRYFCFEVVVCYSNLGKWLCSTNKNMHIAHTKPLSLPLPIFFFYIEIHAHKHIHTFEHRLEIGQIGKNKKWRRKKNQIGGT